MPVPLTPRALNREILANYLALVFIATTPAAADHHYGFASRLVERLPRMPASISASFIRTLCELVDLTLPHASIDAVRKHIYAQGIEYRPEKALAVAPAAQIDFFVHVLEVHMSIPLVNVRTALLFAPVGEREFRCARCHSTYREGENVYGSCLLEAEEPEWNPLSQVNIGPVYDDMCGTSLSPRLGAKCTCGIVRPALRLRLPTPLAAIDIDAARLPLQRLSCLRRRHTTPAPPPAFYLPTLFAAGNHSAQPYFGLVETPLDALRLVNAARHSLIPLTTRRLKQDERHALIRSGSVFVFNVRTSRIKRWTDGLAWTISYDTGSFLLYYERPANLPRREASRHGLNDQLTGPENLMKKAITVVVGEEEYHLVAYFTAADQESGRLRGLASRPDILRLPIDRGMIRLDGRVAEVGPGFGDTKAAAARHSTSRHTSFSSSRSASARSSPALASLYGREIKPKQEYSSPVLSTVTIKTESEYWPSPEISNRRPSLSRSPSSEAKYRPPADDPGPPNSIQDTDASHAPSSPYPPLSPCRPSLRAVHMWPDSPA
ncbi:hypothetical protein MKEN_01417200 [Mycena kentingensis (nom. inval.)]|nr:hypothetical protein MKEN_01417200 [Mycena kentingensis (nom. inval.)]